MIRAAYRVEWTEYERGWGQRPDGTSYYATKELAELAVKTYNEKYNNEEEVPECYTSPGKPTLVEVDEKLYARVQEAAKRGCGEWA